MAIQILDNLTASPNPTTLGKRIDLRQTLVSNRAQESIRIAYRLDPRIDVWFQDGDAAPAKSFVRQETVGQTAKVCDDRITLVLGPGTGPIDIVQIDQTITDQGGLATPDLVLVQIQR